MLRAAPSDNQLTLHMVSKKRPDDLFLLGCFLQPCQQWVGTLKEVHVPSLLHFWATPTSRAPRPDEVMARCGAPPPRAMMMTANGAFARIKV